MTVINNIPCCGGEVCVQLLGTFLSEDKHCQASVVTALKNIINMARKYHFYFSSKTLHNWFKKFQALKYYVL